MAKLKTVKQVCELTGLNRREIAEYSNSIDGIIKPSGYSNTPHQISKNGKLHEGYKLFDDEAVTKFQQIAIFRELKLEKKAIKKIIGDSNYDKNRVFEEQLILLEKEKRKIEHQIIAIKQLQSIGTNNGNLEILTYKTSLEKIGLNIKFYESKYQDFFALIKSKINDIYLDELETALQNFYNLSCYDFPNITLEQTVKTLIDTNIKHLGFFGLIFIGGLALIVIGKGEYADAAENIGFPLSEEQAVAIVQYIKLILHDIENDIDDITLEYSNIIGNNFSEPEVLKMINSIKEVCSHHLGMEQDQDFQLVFDSMHIEPYENGKSSPFDYVLNALKYYCYLDEDTASSENDIE